MPGIVEGEILQVSADGEQFLVRIGGPRRSYCNVFRVAQPCGQVALETGDLVKGRLDSMHPEPITRLRDGQVFEATGELGASIYKDALRYIG